MNHLKDLSAEQKIIIKDGLFGPVRIVAGPGAGKTTMIISKGLFLIEKGHCFPSQILVLTFTNKAASELKERFQQAGQKLKNVFTFHSFAAYFLRVEAKRISIDQNYIILDRNDQIQIIKREIKKLIKENDDDLIDLNPKELLENFATYRNQKQEAFNNSDGEKNRYKELLFKLYNRYLLYKKDNNAFDFDDLLFEIKKVLENYPQIREQWKERFHFLFVDEFQDVNLIQFQILKLLTNPNSNVTVVGDPDQNIYSWRGSDYRIIINFDRYFQDVKTFLLQDNYRSTGNIVRVANKLISKNNDRIVFESKPIHHDFQEPFVFSYRSKMQQAHEIINKIQFLNKVESIPLNEIAIIYRANYLSREFENLLIEENIHYQIIGGYKFFERKEVKEVLLFLRFLLRQDDHAFINIINLPPRGFGKKSLEKLQELATNTHQKLWDVLLENIDKYSSKIKDFINFTSKTIIDLADIDFKKENQFYLLLKNYLETIGFLTFYQNDYNRIANIEGILEQLQINISNSENVVEELLQLLNDIALQSANDKSDIPQHLTLITAHAAKGTEYQVVFIPFLNEKIFPSYQAESSKALEEERRIFYVAITRAKRQLYFSYIQGYDFMKESYLEPSRFLSEMNLKLFQTNFDFDSKNYFSEKKDNSSEKDLKKEEIIPKGYSNKRMNVRVNDQIFHQKYKEGIVIFEEKDYIHVAFSSSIGVKILIKNHPSWFLKIKF